MNCHSVSPQALPHTGWVANLFFAICVLTLNFSPALAGTFNVSPVKINLSKNSSTAIISVSNAGNSDTTIQLQTMRWIQEGEGDKLQPTREIIATPQIFSLKAGATQLIRVGMVTKPDPVNEIAYRLILDEIPSPPEPGFKGLQVALKITLPIFVQPQSKSVPELDFSWLQTQDKKIRVSIANHGSAHVQILRTKISDESDEKSVFFTQEKSLYILPGQSRYLEFAPTDQEITPVKIFLIKTETSTGDKVFHAKYRNP
jgi:fimbrial chaperone protein